MPQHWTLTALLIILIITVVKAGHLFIKLALTLGMGLIGLYLLHKLAQDYNKIRMPVKAAQTAGRLLGLWKRSIPDEPLLQQFHTKSTVLDPFTFLDEKFADEGEVDSPVFHPNFDTVLQYDQKECARRLVCTLATRKLLNKNESTILKLIKLKSNQKDSQGRVVFEKAAAIGYKSKDPKKCKEAFKKCRMTDRQMQIVMRVF